MSAAVDPGATEVILDATSTTPNSAAATPSKPLVTSPSQSVTAAPSRSVAAAPSRSVAAATWALFAGLALVMAGNGLQGSVLGVRSAAEGFSVVVTGLVMAGYFAGFMVGSRFAVHLLGQVGHIRVFAALASSASSTVLLYAVFVNPFVWGLMRFVFGVCMAGLYVVVESWLNELATNATRGRILSVYMLVTMGSMSGGQLLLGVGDTTGFALFIVASILVSLSLVPITLSTSSNPTVPEFTSMSIRELLRIVPTGAVSSFGIGAASGALIGMGAVYAAGEGLDSGAVGRFMTAPLVGAMVLQWPVGWLSDRLPRRGVMLALSVTATLTSVLLVAADPASSLGLGLMFMIGGCLFPLYSLSIAYSNDWLPPEKIVGASAVLVRINGTGAIVGPLLGAALMAVGSSGWFFFTITGSMGVISVYVIYRMLFKDALPMERQRRFVVFPARAASLGANLIRPERRKKPGTAESS